MVFHEVQLDWTCLLLMDLGNHQLPDMDPLCPILTLFRNIILQRQGAGASFPAPAP